MRVAYQAGVITALEEGGLRFSHIDGTSGGTMNLSMLLTGQDSQEMADRWRALDPKCFSSPLPARTYLSPHWPGLGGGRGIREKVFPALGISVDRITRAEGVNGTYNVCNFASKTAEVIEHQDVDEDLLVAAISLPLLMPAVDHRGSQYTDAVWIRDSNVPESVRRGCDEIWLVWCIGNTARYMNGLFRQYVHMIEMAANGTLLEDLRHLGDRPIRLHVIKPARPIPLDPDYFLGRVDAAELIGMGYRDARAYLKAPAPLTSPWGPGVTAMLPELEGVAGRLVLSGRLDGALEVHLRCEAPAGRLEMEVVGDVTIPGWPARRPVEGGRVTFGRGGVAMELRLGGTTGPHRLEARSAPCGRQLDVTLRDEETDEEISAGYLTFGPRERARLIGGLLPLGPHTLVSGGRARIRAAHGMWSSRG